MLLHHVVKRYSYKYIARRVRQKWEPLAAPGVKPRSDMSFVNPLNLIAKQLALQKGLQAHSFIDHLMKEGLVSSDEVGRLKGMAIREDISGWVGVLRFLRSKHPSRGLDALQSMIGKEDALSRDVLSRLQHLWISGNSASLYLSSIFGCTF